jgi:hypothetical protein
MNDHDIQLIMDMRRNDELQDAQIRRNDFILYIASHIITFVFGVLVATLVLM